MEKKVFPLIDFLKFFFAIVIAALHVFAEYSALEWLNSILNVLAQIALAFFFVASGFFSFSKYAKTQDHKVFGCQALRLLILYGIYNVLYYAVCVLAPGIVNKTGLGEPTLAFVRDMLVGGTSVMWFIWSLIVVNTVMFFVAWKPINVKRLAVVSASVGLAFYVGFYVVFNSYGSSFIPTDTYSPIVGHWAYFGLIRLLGGAIPFVAAGYLVAAFADGFQPCKGVIVGMTCLGAAAFVAEYLLTRRLLGHGVCYGAAMPILVFFGFVALVAFDNLTPKPVFKLMRNASTAIYLIHAPIMNLMHQLFKLESVPKAEGFIPFLAILFLSLLYFALVYWAKRFKGLRWLRYLY